MGEVDRDGAEHIFDFARLHQVPLLDAVDDIGALADLLQWAVHQPDLFIEVAALLDFVEQILALGLPLRVLMLYFVLLLQNVGDFECRRIKMFLQLLVGLRLCLLDLLDHENKLLLHHFPQLLFSRLGLCLRLGLQVMSLHLLVAYLNNLIPYIFLVLDCLQ